MILMLRNFQFNALSRGNQRPNFPYKKAWRDTFGGVQFTSVATRNSVILLLESSLLNIDISLTTIYILQVEPAVTSHLQLIKKIFTHNRELMWT
jgi:hypothetical protein